MTPFDFELVVLGLCALVTAPCPFAGGDLPGDLSGIASMTALFPREAVGPGHFLEVVVESTDLKSSTIAPDPRRNEYDPLGRVYHVWPIEGTLKISLVRDGVAEEMGFTDFDRTFGDVASLADVVPGDDMRKIDPPELSQAKATLTLPRKADGARLSAEMDNNCDWEFYGINHRKKVASRIRATVSGIQEVKLTYRRYDVEQSITMVDGNGVPADGNVQIILRNVPPAHAGNPNRIPHFNWYYRLAQNKVGNTHGRNHVPVCKQVTHSAKSDRDENAVDDSVEHLVPFVYGRPVSCAVCQACSP